MFVLTHTLILPPYRVVFRSKLRGMYQERVQGHSLSNASLVAGHSAGVAGSTFTGPTEIQAPNPAQTTPESNLLNAISSDTNTTTKETTSSKTTDVAQVNTTNTQPSANSTASGVSPQPLPALNPLQDMYMLIYTVSKHDMQDPSFSTWAKDILKNSMNWAAQALSDQGVPIQSYEPQYYQQYFGD